jgi:hypothetical protein
VADGQGDHDGAIALTIPSLGYEPSASRLRTGKTLGSVPTHPVSQTSPASAAASRVLGRVTFWASALFAAVVSWM